jgi:pyruvate/2-oxoglutarate dehydrogenase complex dihydrolipoamide acyltransferase (E2) component
MSFDHTIIDGAPAARFATVLRGLLESAAVLEKERHATLVQG